MEIERENRKFTRMPLNVPVKISLPCGTLHEFDQFGDISLGGCQVSSKAEFEMYSDCNIEILLNTEHFSESSTVQILGKIMRIGYDFTGIKFIRFDSESLNLLQKLLRRYAPDPDIVDTEFEQHLGFS